jgi:hypothetical protein
MQALKPKDDDAWHCLTLTHFCLLFGSGGEVGGAVRASIEIELYAREV